MTTQARAQVDKLLTNVSQKIMPLGYISEEILPQLNVVQYSGLIAKYGNDHLRIVNDVVGGKAKYPMVESDVRQSDTYHIESHALKQIVTKEDYRNVERPFDAERDAVQKLTTHLWLGKEFSLASALGDTGVVTNNVTLAGTDQYNDFTNSDPLGDFATARESVYSNTGLPPDLAIMSWSVKNVLKYHPQMLDSLGYKDNRPGGLSDQELARALDVDRILIGSAIYNSAKQGQVDALAPVWGKNIIFTHSPRNAALAQVTLGYRVQLSGQSPRQVFRAPQDEPIDSVKIMVIDEYDMLLTKVSAAYLIKDAVA